MVKTMEWGSTLRITRPYPHVVAFYDGRLPGHRLHSEADNWLDDGAYTLGTASYAIVDGDEALVYDAHMTLIHARLIRSWLEEHGYTKLRLIVSHWHTDHVAGNAVFADCQIIANGETFRLLEDNREALESGDPPIKPLIMPNVRFDRSLHLTVGSLKVELRHLDIHSIDETVLMVPDYDLVLAADTLEDTITYVSEPDRLADHLKDLARFESWPDFSRILPNHGSFEQIEAGGYDRRFITATRLYTEKLLALPQHPEWAELSLQDFAAEALATGGVVYFEAYEKVHRGNVAAVLGVIRER